MVSAIITTHNRKNLLDRAIQSVLNQTYKDIELIVVSDGSTDGTDEQMKKYETDIRVKYITYSPGRGGNYARNTGIKAANGKYVAFLDDDDEWLPTKIEKQVQKIESDSLIGIVYTGLKSIYVKEGVSYLQAAGFEGDASIRILLGNVIGTTSTAMIKKEVLDKSGYFDENLKALQDYDLWVRVCQVANIGFVNEPLINYYNLASANQVSDKTSLYEDSKKYIHNKYQSLYSKLSEAQIKTIESNDCIGLAKNCIRNGNSSKGRKYIIKALRKKFSVVKLIYWLLSFLPFKYILKIRNLM